MFAMTNAAFEIISVKLRGAAPDVGGLAFIPAVTVTVRLKTQSHNRKIKAGQGGGGR